MAFKLRLAGYIDGNKIVETENIQEFVNKAFVKYRTIHENTHIEERIDTFVMPLQYATVRSIAELAEMHDQPVPYIVHNKSAPTETVGFTYFPTYKVKEYKEDYATVTFHEELVYFDNDFIWTKRCLIRPLITTNYYYVDDGNIPVEVNYVEGLLNQLEEVNNYVPQDDGFILASVRTNMHQIWKQHPPFGGQDLVDCVNFGVITRDKEIEYSFTSGEPYDLRVSEILIPAWLGIELPNLHVGDILKAGETITFTIYAYSNLGRDDVHDFFTIKFEEVVPRYTSYQKISICVDIHRRQAPDILIEPDKGSYHESIEYMTKQYVSSTNVVSSMPLMVNWKYSCKYDVTMHRTDYHKSFINILKAGKHIVFQHPLWSQVTILNEEMQTQLRCKCNTDWCDFREGEWAFVYVAPDEYYLRQIDTIYPDSLIFTRNLSAPAGSFVIPAFPAIVKGPIKTTYIGERHIKGTIEVIEFREGKYYVPY